MDESLRRDRLSELPDSLIHEILSLLDMRDVVRTTILSKRWEDLWISVPCLNFSDSSESIVHGALAKWKGTKILKFSIFCHRYPSSRRVVDSWLLVPIEKQVEDLLLYVYVPNVLDEYSPPQRLYSCSSLTKLCIGSCHLEIVENVQWYQLKSLTIDNPISFTDGVLNRILSGAPLLEELVLQSLDISEDFSIRSTSLKMLEIGRNDCICLKELVGGLLRISGCVYGTCLLDVPSLTSVALRFEDYCPVRFRRRHTEEEFPPLEKFDKVFRSIGHVEKLTLSSLCIQSLLNIKEDNMITFSNTKFLKLYAGSAKEMLDVLEMFPQLMTLVVEHEIYCDEYDEYDDDTFNIFKSKKPEVDVFQSSTSKTTFTGPFLHQLKAVEISWCACDDTSILSAIELLLQNARLLDMMVFQPKWWERHRCNQKLWLKAKEKVKCMPRSSPTAKVVLNMSSKEGTRILF